MNNVAIKIDATKFQKFLVNAPSNVGEALNIAVRKITYLIEGKAKRLAPVDTGRLRSTIFNHISPLSAYISTNVNYARFIHEGTRYISARPFMKDAVKQTEGEVDQILKEELNKALEK